MVALAVAAVTSGAAKSQSFYVGFGPGLSVQSGKIDGVRLALLANATYQRHNWQVSGRFVECLDWHINLGLSGGGSKIIDRTRELALLAGIRGQSDSHSSISFEAGIGSVSGHTDESILDSSGYPIGHMTFSAVGLALQSQFYYKRIGLMLFGNLNSEQSFGGLSLTFRLGSFAILERQI